MRNSEFITKDIYIASGNDHALGHFFQVYDKRTEEKSDEGIVFDADRLFGVQMDLINLAKGEKDYSKLQFTYEMIQEACDEYINSDKYKQMLSYEEAMKKLDEDYNRREEEQRIEEVKCLCEEGGKE